MVGNQDVISTMELLPAAIYKAELQKQIKFYIICYYYSSCKTLTVDILSECPVSIV